ncbi:gamma-aminobutyric acid type B receptor subunit 2-like [Convolutriloba macropyga]|uniref:gamma-aminobutyric acid type B receptor subunit 2-like n=1 Tax=Convolutriloba macropyga TaxID=536237 RepID=UPI003F52755B
MIIVTILSSLVTISLSQGTSDVGSDSRGASSISSASSSIDISLVVMYAGLKSPWRDGIGNLIAAQLAADDVTRRHVSRHNGRTRQRSKGGLNVTIIPFDGNCSSYLEPDKFAQLSALLRRPDVKGVIGPECSHHSNGVVSFFAHPFFRDTGYQKPFLTPSATSRDPFYLGPKGETQLFAQLVPGIQQTQQLSVSIAHRFNWTKFGVLHSMETLPWVNSLEKVMAGGLKATVIQQANMTQIEMRRQLQVFLDHDLHVFFILITSGWEVLCQAASMGLMGGENVWFVDAWLWDIIKTEISYKCTPAQVELVLDSNPLIDVQEWSWSYKPPSQTISGFSSAEIIQRVDETLAQRDVTLSANRNPSWDLLAYDCVWLMCLAVERVMHTCEHNVNIPTSSASSPGTEKQIRHVTHHCNINNGGINNNSWPLDKVSLPYASSGGETLTLKGNELQKVTDNWAELVMGQMHLIEFEGVSGRVGLQKYQTKYPQVRAFYYQFWNNTKPLLDANSEQVTLKDNFNWSDWKNTSEILDYTIKMLVVRRNETEQISLPLALGGNIACALMTVFCLFLLAFNFHFRRQKLIKMTSPTINNLILLGSLLIYMSTVLSSASAFTTDTFLLSLSCRAELCLMSLGFTLGYGSLFSKTWRIYKIFIDRNAGGTQVRVRDQQLLMFVLGFTCGEIVFLTVWMLVSPLTVVQQMGQIEKKLRHDHVLEIQWISLRCVSKITVFPYLLLSIKAFVLLYGAFLAYETRGVHIEELNDSRSIGVSIYNTIILSSFGLLASLAIHTDPSMHYLLLSAIKVFCVAITMCVIFLPKMRQLQKDPEGKNLNVTRRLTRPSMSNHSQMNNNNVKNGSNNNINNYHGANIDLGAQQAGHQKVSLKPSDVPTLSLERKSSSTRSDISPAPLQPPSIQHPLITRSHHPVTKGVSFGVFDSSASVITPVLTPGAAHGGGSHPQLKYEPIRNVDDLPDVRRGSDVVSISDPMATAPSTTSTN